jgi:pimeloyl-ACP methyl ester carboxylesterase
MSEILSKKGIASLRFDFLGSGDSEGLFSELTPQLCVQNLVDVVQAVCLSSFVPNAPRFVSIGLFGRSFGGYICLQASSFIKDLKAIAVQSPPFDAEAFSSLPPYFCEEWGKLSFMGEPISEKFLPEMQQLDMTAALERLKDVPFLHISCENDRVIGAEHTQKFKKARGQSHPKTQFELILGADHECSSFSSRNIVLEKVSSWFIDLLKTSKE